MGEIIAMFRSTRMVKLTAFCATVFAIVAVVFKNSIVLIPEVTEIRPVNALALTFGLFFGPAGAVGCAVGNLISDFSGSLTWLSPFGMLGNFLSAWLPYKVWDALLPKEQIRPAFQGRYWGLRIGAVTLVSTVSCGAVLAFAFDTQGTLAALPTFQLIFVNNFAATVLLGVPLLYGVTRLPQKVVPYWREWMAEADYAADTPTAPWKTRLLIGLSLLCLLVMVCLSVLNALQVFNGEVFGCLPLLVFFAGYVLIVVIVP